MLSSAGAFLSIGNSKVLAYASAKCLLCRREEAAKAAAKQ